MERHVGSISRRKRPACQASRSVRRSLSSHQQRSRVYCCIARKDCHLTADVPGNDAWWWNSNDPETSRGCYIAPVSPALGALLEEEYAFLVSCCLAVQSVSESTLWGSWKHRFGRNTSSQSA